MNGTAYPTWSGNSVITAHVKDANGRTGAFANLKNLAFGSQIVVHQFGEKYTLEVRQSSLVLQSSTGFAFQHLPGHSYLTLITCQGYNFLTDSYISGVWCGRLTTRGWYFYAPRVDRKSG